MLVTINTDVDQIYNNLITPTSSHGGACTPRPNLIRHLTTFTSGWQECVLVGHFFTHVFPSSHISLAKIHVPLSPRYLSPILFYCIYHTPGWESRTWLLILDYKKFIELFEYKKVIIKPSKVMFWPDDLEVDSVIHIGSLSSMPCVPELSKKYKTFHIRPRKEFIHYNIFCKIVK